MVGNWGTTPNSPSLVLALIDMLVVQSQIMWSWSTANSQNWTSCFLFSSLLACFPVWHCFSVVYCCTFSFVSGNTVWVFFPFLSHIVHCNLAFGPRFCANKILSYHIISYHIISYHIISYHIISYHIIYHIIPIIVIGPSRKLTGSDKWQYLNFWMSNLNETKVNLQLKKQTIHTVKCDWQ